MRKLERQPCFDPRVERARDRAHILIEQSIKHLEIFGEKAIFLRTWPILWFSGVIIKKYCDTKGVLRGKKRLIVFARHC